MRRPSWEPPALYFFTTNFTTELLCSKHTRPGTRKTTGFRSSPFKSLKGPAKGSQELQQQMLTASDMRQALGAPGIQRMEGPGGWVACRDLLETMGLKQSLPDREELGKQKNKRKKDGRRGWCLESEMIEHLGSNR